MNALPALDLRPATEAQPRFLSDLVREAAEPHGFTPDDLIPVHGPRRAERARARWAVMWALRQRGLSTTRIGMVLKRDHSTVLLGIRAHERRMGEGA